MPRNIRHAVFLDPLEESIIRLVKASDDAIGVTIRKLAIMSAMRIHAAGKGRTPGVSELEMDRFYEAFENDLQEQFHRDQAQNQCPPK